MQMSREKGKRESDSWRVFIFLYYLSILQHKCIFALGTYLHMNFKGNIRTYNEMLYLSWMKRSCRAKMPFTAEVSWHLPALSTMKRPFCLA